MKLGRVIGRVVLNIQDPAYAGGRFLLVQPLGNTRSSGTVPPAVPPAASAGPVLVAWDDLGSSDGDLVGYSESGGASAPFAFSAPVDAYIGAILDHWTHQPQP